MAAATKSRKRKPKEARGEGSVAVDPLTISVSTIAAIAKFLNTSERTVSRWAARGMPGRRGCYVLAEVVAWARQNEWNLPDVSSDDAPMLTGAASPALEDWRKARAEQEQMKLLRMRGDLVAIEDVRSAMNATKNVMKETVERLVRLAGNEMASILNEGWVQVERQLEQLFDERANGERGLKTDAAE